jgi:TolB protein
MPAMRFSGFFFTAILAYGQAGTYPAARTGSSYMWNYYLPPAPGSTPWAPAWSPDGKYIAVSMQGSLWRVDPSTGAAVELTHDRTYDSSPAFSPDGKWLAYTADNDGRDIQLRILDLSTGQSHALTSGADVYLDPVFSPDGTRLAYVSTRPNGYFNIYVRPIRDGQWAGEPVALTSDNRYPRDRLYFGAWDIHAEPAWTRDGREILFLSNRDVPLGSGDLWRMPAEAGGAARAKRILSEITLFRTRADVSPDGTRIVYSSSSGTADEHNQLYLLPLGGGAPYRLTFDAWDHFHPRWSPDGEWIAYISNEGGLPQLCLLETYGGARRRITISRRQWKQPMGRLHVRILDGEKPAAARVYFLAADGKFYPPATAYARIGSNNRHVIHVDGEFTADLPPGHVTVQALRGFEYGPAEAAAEVRAGETAELRLSPERLIDMPAQGWWSGSTHTHMNYGGSLHNTLENMMMMSRAEDQHEVNVLTANKDTRVFDVGAFVRGGGAHPVSTPDEQVVVGEEYRPPFWGHVFLLGLRDHLISPFTTGYEGTAIASLYPSNTDIFRKAAAEGAVTGYVHPWGFDDDPLNRDLGVAKAFPVDAALGTVNALEWSTASHTGLNVWHKMLNNDFPITPTGGEDSISNLHRGKLIGSVRTFVYTGPKFTATAWLDALRRGRTFFSTGPLLVFQVNDQLPGGAIHLPPEGGEVEIQARCQAWMPVTKLVIYRNGVILRELKPGEPFRERVRVTESGWYSLYAEGPPHRDLDAAWPQAATNAIRVYVGNGRIRDPESSRYFLRWIDKLQTLAAAWPWWRTEGEKQHVFAQFDEASKIYRTR